MSRLLLSRLFVVLGTILATGCASSLILQPEMADYYDQKFDRNPRYYHEDNFREFRLKNQNDHTLVGQLHIPPTAFGPNYINHRIRRRGEGSEHRPAVSADIIERVEPRAVVVMFGGNGMGEKSSAYYSSFLLGENLIIIGASYQGYGESEGEADLRALKDDALTFLNYINETFPDKPLIVIGVSMGTMPVFAALPEVDFVDGVIVEGTVLPRRIAFTKIKQAWALYPLLPISLPYAAFFSWSVPSELNTWKNIENVSPNLPAFFIHHPEDTVVPYSNGVSAFAKHPGKDKWLISPDNPKEATQHINLKADFAMREIKKFITMVVKRDEQRKGSKPNRGL